jgi:hypothetical protein
MDISKMLTEGRSHQMRLSDETKALVKKWEDTGLLEEIEDDITRSGMATLLENQAKQLVKEASQTGTSTNSEEWAGVALPLVRRIFDEIVAKNFVSVQPMNLPSGLVFYLDFKYGTNQPGFVTGSGKDSQADSVFGITDTTGDASGGLYGAGRFGYTINDVDSATQALGATVTTNQYATGSVTATDYNFDTQFSASNLTGLGDGTIATVSVPTASLPSFDDKGIRAFRLAGIDAQFPAYTRLQGGNIVFVAQAAAFGDVTVRFHKQPTDTTRGDFEAQPAYDTTLDIPELNVEMKSEPIVAKTRKLKAQWTPEFAQDLNAYHSIDAEAELTSMLSEYISQEIDFEILDMLIQDAKTTGYWSTQVGREWDGNNFADFSSTQAQSSAYTQQAWFQTLGTVIAGVSNKIHQKTLRGGANFLVVSPDVSTIIESIPGYTSTANNGDSEYAFGVTKMGSLAGRFQVYKNPYMQDNVILMGYRGTQFLETGAVYSPYIPLIMTPLVYDPQNFTPRKGVMTRYAKKMLRGEFYGKVYVDGLHRIQ